MTNYWRMILIVSAVLASELSAAQTQPPPSNDQKGNQALERCKLNRGVDCDTPEGLKEWLLQERSREEAIRDGSRHRVPAQPRPAPSRR